MSENKKTPEQLAQEQAAKEAEDAKKKAEADEKARIKAAQSGSYLPAEKERGIYHVQMDKPLFSKKDGKKLSKAFIQKFTIPEWNHFVKNSKGLGFETKVMWDPTKYSN